MICHREDGEVQAVEAEDVVTVDPAYELAVTPTVQKVARRLWARTKGKGGETLGTFTADTRPTDVEAEEFIDSSVGEVTSSCPALSESRWVSAALGLLRHHLLRQPHRFERLSAGVVFLDRQHLAAAEGVDSRVVDLGLQAAALASVSPPLLQD